MNSLFTKETERIQGQHRRKGANDRMCTGRTIIRGLPYVIVLEHSHGSLENTEQWEELGRLIAVAEHNNKNLPDTHASQ